MMNFNAVDNVIYNISHLRRDSSATGGIVRPLTNYPTSMVTEPSLMFTFFVMATQMIRASISHNIDMAILPLNNKESPR